MAIWSGKKKRYFIPLLLFIAITVMLTIFGDKGLIRIYKLSKGKDSIMASIKAATEKIKTENAAMREEIERLKSDDKYIEMVARKELGMIGKNEMVYKFGK